jgi:hypothetical protein
VDLLGPDNLDRTAKIKPEREITGEVRVPARNPARAVRWWSPTWLQGLLDDGATMMRLSTARRSWKRDLRPRLCPAGREGIGWSSAARR